MTSLAKLLVLVSLFSQFACSENDETVDLYALLQVEVLTTELSSPWGMVQLPDGALLITEKTGSARLWSRGRLSHPISRTPEAYVAGQGGLLDVVLHPEYEKNGWIYLSYAYGDRRKNATRLVRTRLSGLQFSTPEVLFTATRKNTAAHFGGRMTFLPDRTLLLTVGDGYSFKDQAQELSSTLGKIIRLNGDGSIPDDNPFVALESAKPEIYSLGHRNPQGIYFDPERKVVFSNEHGPKGGDEINIIESGKNYGWPKITYGVDYSGEVITPHSALPGLEQPLVDWTPSIAPSSIIVYYGQQFPEFRGHLLSTTLKYRELRLTQLSGTKVVNEVSLLTEWNERFRDLLVGSEGEIYLLTDSGKLMKVTRR
ncbi:glucose/sorbosone dehydrogenase [Oleiphilus messinensis]|uniref:Glucose/sorbosone dehydrogenase n=1 Tax=Oleiphilus messinensis TaxID=141451 RepID=A0A1Y0IAG2_9GAMM|nr:PQQ-dependent sugar dehydrogenase [Oleiphilus messinensis]ARU56746.1 glucose/sorbosone dehydrogenase [Oleiphilus messinensis]